MNELASLGVILLFALLAGHVVKFVRVPEVTGYIVAGIAVGPSALGWITQKNLATLGVFSEVALGLILFSIGSVFEFKRFREIGWGVARLTLFESMLVAALVTGVMFWYGEEWKIALMLGAIAMETAAATTLMVLRESNAHGPVSEILTAMIGFNNIVCLLAFSVVAGAADLTLRLQRPGSLLRAIYEVGFPLLWQIVGSAALGFLIGLLLANWSAKVSEHGETLILMIGCVLLCVGLSITLDLSPLVASLAVGATMVNVSDQGRRLFQALSRTDPPLYAIFFVIAGAELNLKLLSTVGVVSVLYFAARATGKLIGAFTGAGWTSLRGRARSFFTITTQSHAGLAVGLSLAATNRFPDFGPKVAAVVLSCVIVYELIGPIATRIAIGRVGEVQVRQPEPIGVLD